LHNVPHVEGGVLNYLIHLPDLLETGAHVVGKYLKFLSWNC